MVERENQPLRLSSSDLHTQCIRVNTNNFTINPSKVLITGVALEPISF